MTGTMKVAALQLALGDDRAENIAAVGELVAEAAEQGARVVLPPELFASRYFCQTEDEALFDLARPLADAPAVAAMRRLAETRNVAIPASFFERDGPHYYNSIAMIAPGGDVLGVYRKSHIPDGPGYEEKYFFRPGNSGFRVWDVCGARVGVGICWDQWFPEAARAMALMGAEVIFYPSAIGSEPDDPDFDTSAMWRGAMTGHAICNAVPVVASNRIGAEPGPGAPQRFYGHSFIADERGELVAAFDDVDSGVLTATLDLDRARRHRAGMGFFRDRRPELYGRLTEDS